MNEDKGLSPLGAEMVAGLSAFCDAIESGVPVDARYTVRTVSLDLHPKPYSSQDVKHLRKQLSVSQTVFAEFLGVSVKAVRSWEQGLRPVPTIACRFMDEIVDNPELWSNRLRLATRPGKSEAIGS